jgi:molybdate transport system ATP-binding protein
MAVDISIKKDFGEFTLAVDYKGEARRIGILGASGSGKSLTLKCIAGIEKPDSGFISVDGRILYDSSNKVNLPPQKRRVGYLFQNYALFPNMSVEENIASGVTGDKKQKAEVVKKTIEKFKLEEFSKRLPSKLSGGQQQRVALARIIASKPDVIMLDEPFSALDAYMRDEMQKSLQSMLDDFDGTVITVSHSRDEIYTMSDEVIVVDKGVASACGKTADIFKNPPNKAAAVLTGCKNISDCVVKGKNKVFAVDWGIETELDNIPQGIKGLAVRAHDFLLSDNGKGNLLRFDVVDAKIKEELFEYVIYFKASQNSKKIMCFKISSYMWNPEKNGIPRYLYLDKEKMLMFC